MFSSSKKQVSANTPLKFSSKNVDSNSMKVIQVEPQWKRQHWDKITVILPLSRTSFASGSSDGTVVIWNKNTERAMATLRHSSEVVTVLAKLSDQYLAVACVDGSITLWNLKDYRKKTVICSHEYKITTMIASDAYLIVGYHDGVVSFHQMKSQADGEIKKKVRSILFNSSIVRGHEKRINALISMEGYLVASGSWDGFVIVWDLKTQASVFKLNFEIPIYRMIKIEDLHWLIQSRDETSLYACFFDYNRYQLTLEKKEKCDLPGVFHRIRPYCLPNSLLCSFGLAMTAKGYLDFR